MGHIDHTGRRKRTRNRREVNRRTYARDQNRQRIESGLKNARSVDRIRSLRGVKVRQKMRMAASKEASAISTLPEFFEGGGSQICSGFLLKEGQRGAGGIWSAFASSS